MRLQEKVEAEQERQWGQQMEMAHLAQQLAREKACQKSKHLNQGTSTVKTELIFKPKSDSPGFRIGWVWG
eukprot:706210-Amphidinium_carterae.1